MSTVFIVGGGLAGLVSGIQLANAGIRVIIAEKKSYPLHKVCGEYISNETVPFLKRSKLYPEEFAPPQINTFQLSSVGGKSATMKLEQGGFGISRYTFDHWLYERAKSAGVEFLLNTEVTEIEFDSGHFNIKTDRADYVADVVIGCFGKRSRLDHALKRSFVSKRSPYVGVKYHLRRNHPDHLIALHNFSGGYCGISNVEQGKTNLCYLVHRDQLRKFGDIKAMEEAVLYQNPFLREIFVNSDFIFEKPEVINEVSFASKKPVEEHILMAGDAAGMITPLCGNGMAMAIHAAKIVAEEVLSFCEGKTSRLQMESQYTGRWKNEFTFRLWKGRKIQALFGNKALSTLAVNLALYSKPVATTLVRNTHGKPF